jgi:hypothetical protein
VDGQSTRAIGRRPITDSWDAAQVATPLLPTQQGTGARRIESGLLTTDARAAGGVAAANATLAALVAVEDLIARHDLGHARDAALAARRHRDAVPWSTRRALPEWITSAMADTAQAARVERPARDAAIDIRASHWRQAKSTGR